MLKRTAVVYNLVKLGAQQFEGLDKIYYPSKKKYNGIYKAFNLSHSLLCRFRMYSSIVLDKLVFYLNVKF